MPARPRSRIRRRCPRGLLGAVTAVAAVATSAAPGAAAQDALAIMERASEAYGELTSFCADFRQQLHVPLLDQTTRSRGRLCQARPDRFAMHFTDPAGDRVVADGEWLWIHYPSMDPVQVFRSPLNGAEGRFDFHREFLSDPGTRYTPTHQGTERIDGTRCHVIHLRPRAGAPMAEARIWVDSERLEVRKVEIHELNGSVRTLELGPMEGDPSIPPGMFRFTPPEGSQVLTTPGA